MILVTGGTGLVGAHLLLHLTKNEANVRAIYRDLTTIKKTKLLFEQQQSEVLFQKIEWVAADILDIPSLEIAFDNIEFVYHCAAFISFDPKEEEKLRKVNIEGTANIVNFCIAKKVKKLCHVSSIASLGDLATSEKMVFETHEWNPEINHSDYAISKYGAEMEVWRGFQEGLSVIIVNPGVIMGSTIWESGSGVIFAKIKKGFSFFTNGITGYVSVTDVVKAMILLMKSPISGERYTLVAEHFSYKQIIKIIAKSLGKNSKKYEVKSWMTDVFWRIDWFFATFFRKKRTLSKYGALALHNSTYYSNEKIIKTLNFEFQNINAVIEEIIHQEK